VTDESARRQPDVIDEQPVELALADAETAGEEGRVEGGGRVAVTNSTTSGNSACSGGSDATNMLICTWSPGR
jgi:hypothetical protein